MSQQIHWTLLTNELRYIYTERKPTECEYFLRSLSLLNVNIKLDSMWNHLDVNVTFAFSNLNEPLSYTE